MRVPAGLLGLVGLGVAIVLADALAFGLWHVVVGGIVNGNAAAARFGLVLAAASAALLIPAVAAIRRRRG